MKFNKKKGELLVNHNVINYLFIIFILASSKT